VRPVTGTPSRTESSSATAPSTSAGEGDVVDLLPGPLERREPGPRALLAPALLTAGIRPRAAALHRLTGEHARERQRREREEPEEPSLAPGRLRAIQLGRDRRGRSAVALSTFRADGSSPRPGPAAIALVPAARHHGEA
jgi:hypothetical protein